MPGSDVANDVDPADAIAARLPTTDRRSWLLLVAVGLLVLAGVAWAVLGQAPQTVTGRGMVVPEGGFIGADSASSGTVTELLVAPGDTVEKGELMARLVDDRGMEESVIAAADGSVATVIAGIGSVTVPGLPVLTIDPATNNNVVVGFLPAEAGTQVRVGMTALVAIASFPSAQYGFARGTVSAVATVPTTAARVTTLVGGNEQLPEFFLQDGPVIEVTVALDPAPENPSKVAWTVGQGPDTELLTGTLAEVSVVLEESSPLQRLVP